ncbi:MAG: hypothetical protein IPL26_13355 [Leptospiraceae bacterium]|nr:hypothetical protein [Leptospiraceae bacterium]
MNKVGKMDDAIYFDFILPTAKEHDDFSNQFPIDEILDLLKPYVNPTMSINPFNHASLQESEMQSVLNTWYSNVETLLFDIKHAYGFLLFFYNAGIPDERVTGSGTESNKYFPDFKHQDWYNQKSFRFYAEIIISKIFSVLDNYGMILFFHYDKDFIINQFLLQDSNKKKQNIYFYTPIKDSKLKMDALVRKKLQLILDNEVYKKTKIIRNDIVHNKTPLKLSSNLAFVKSENGFGMGLKIDYIKSKEVFEIIENLINDVLIESTKNIFSEQGATHNESN